MSRRPAPPPTEIVPPPTETVPPPTGSQEVDRFAQQKTADSATGRGDASVTTTATVAVAASTGVRGAAEEYYDKIRSQRGDCDEGENAVSIPKVETGTKRSLAGMEHPGKKMRVDGSSSSGAPLSSSAGSVMDAEATDVTHPQDAQAADVPTAQDAPAVGVPALHPPLAPADTEYAKFVLKAMESAVSVCAKSTAGQECAKFYSGFIVHSTDNYAQVYTSFPADALEGELFNYSVHLEENQESVKAVVICEDPDDQRYMILFVPTEKRYPAVSFMDIPVTYERVLTIAAKAGTKLRLDGPIVGDLNFIGKLDLIQGRVLNPSCSASTLEYKHLKGSEKFFEVSCIACDSIVDLEYVDKDKHTKSRMAHRLATAPVFSLRGELLGFIHSIGTEVDVKTGFLCKSIILSIRSMCEADNWVEKLQKLGDSYLAKHFG